MRRLLNNTTIAVLALILPAAAFANITGTQTLNTGQIFSFDTGTVVTSGGDIMLTSSGLTLQGTAKALTGATFGQAGMMDYNILVGGGPSGLSGFASLLSASPIPTSALTVNAIFAVKTVGGNFGAFIITAASAGSITFDFTSFVTSAASGPTISQVLNNYGLIPAGFTNSGIAQGSLFIIKGSNLASASSVTALESSAAPGLPASLNGASVNVTVNGTTTHPAFYYAESIQLALVMPSNTPVGAGTVTVTYNSQTSAAFNINVVASAFGFLSNDGTGTGQARTVNATTGSFYGFNQSIPVNTLVEFYGSGLGADLTRDTTFSQTTSFPFSINALSAVYVGGVQATIQYQGASGYPGLNQVNVIIPANAPTGCFVSVVGVTTAGVPTNFLTLPIGNGVCDDPGLGYSGSTLTNLGGLTTVNTGFVEMIYSSSTAGGQGTQLFTEAGAGFQSYTGTTYTSSTSGIVDIGGCIVTESVASTGGSTGTATGLNAGTITVGSPNAGFAPVTLTSESAFLPGFYASVDSMGNSTLPTGFLTQSGGIFPFTATAGTQVGAFNTSVNFPTPLLAWTNQAAAATVVRSQGLPITWTGGSAGTYVTISGSSSSGSVSGFFSCLAPVAAGQFTVPAYVLATLPASTSGSLSVGNETVPTSFTATGLNFGYAIGIVDYGITAAYQ